MLRNSLRLSALCAGLLLGANAMALSLGDLSQGDATGGLKDALTQGAQKTTQSPPVNITSSLALTLAEKSCASLTDELDWAVAVMRE